MKTSLQLLVAFALIFTAPLAHAAAPPIVGEPAPNFTLRTLDDKAIELNQLSAETAVVLVVLRGWPGYQCPLCTRQVQDFAAKAQNFQAAGARVLMIYPGPAEALKKHARDFLESKQWPADFLLVLDPDYAFTHAYGLRWEAKNETAYPSTFIIGKDGKVRFAQISKTHGGRVSAERAVAELR
jgi:peroxiredoxin Q/BCP